MKILKFRFWILIFILLFSGFRSVTLLKFNGPPIRSDAVGYYSYLPAFFLNFPNLHKGLAEKFTPNEWRAYGFNRHPATGKIFNKYGMGTAVLQAPFFILASIASSISGIEVDGTNRHFQLYIGLAGLVYGFIGLLCLRYFLLAFFPSHIVTISLVTLLFGTNLYHYLTYDSCFSHAFSFFTFSCALASGLAWHRKRSIKSAVTLGLALGLSVLIRAPDALPIAVLFAAYLYYFRKTFQTHSQKIQILFIGLAALATFSPQLWYWKTVSGSWILNAYGVYDGVLHEGFDFLRPNFPVVLWLPTKGLFFWSPALLLCLIGLVALWKNYRFLSFALTLMFSLQVYVTASWHMPTFAGAFGHRGFVNILPLLAIPLAYAIEQIYKRGYKKPLNLAIILCAAFTLRSMLLYWQGKIAFGAVSLEQLGSVFF